MNRIFNKEFTKIIMVIVLLSVSILGSVATSYDVFPQPLSAVATRSTSCIGTLLVSNPGWCITQVGFLNQFASQVKKLTGGEPYTVYFVLRTKVNYVNYSILLTIDGMQEGGFGGCCQLGEANYSILTSHSMFAESGTHTLELTVTDRSSGSVIQTVTETFSVAK
jgi:hypothetical protein